MVSLFRCRVVSFLLMALPVMSQDVAAPSMPEVDDYRRTPEFVRGREAVARYMFFWALCGRIVLLESDAQGNMGDGIIVGRLLNQFPEKILDGCPEVFRKVWLEPLEKIKTALNENPEWLETPEGKNQIKETEKALNYLEEEYGAGKMVQLSGDWINKWVGDREQNVPETVLKKLLQLKNDLESGKATVPLDDILRSGADEEAGG